MNDSSSALSYLVHYVGWNSRFDEWVGRDVIVGLAEATPARAGRPSKSLAKVEKLMYFIVGEFCWCCIILCVSVQWFYAHTLQYVTIVILTYRKN